MATSRRVSRVAELIKREVSQMLLHDIKDDRVGAGIVSVTDVDVSGDLQHAKIFVSIYGTDEARAETMAGLKSATGYVRSELGHRVRLRRTPEVVFQEDRSIERGTRVLSLINQLSRDPGTGKSPYSPSGILRQAHRPPEDIAENEDSIKDQYDAEILAEEETK